MTSPSASSAPLDLPAFSEGAPARLRPPPLTNTKLPVPIIEIASFAVSEAFLADLSILTPAFDFLIGVDGCLGYVKLNLTQSDGTYEPIYHQSLSWDP